MRIITTSPTRNRIEQEERKYQGTNLVGISSNYGSFDDNKSEEIVDNNQINLVINSDNADEEKAAINYSEAIIPPPVTSFENNNQGTMQWFYSFCNRMLCSQRRIPSLLFNESIPQLRMESRSKILIDLPSILGLIMLINKSSPSTTDIIFAFLTNASNIAIEKLIPSQNYKSIKNQLSNLKILLLFTICIMTYQSACEIGTISQVMKYALLIVNIINTLLNIE